ncbi:MAG: hypothetical protein M4579_006564 [Chaenotheca gracillima]|nr:MAG: hypothetical protein M4579_006564 [Chaenotheca gracillima]
MPSLEFVPDVLLDEPLVQSRCELPHRVYATKVYPVLAPNGSSVVVYGHEYGLRILWSGGRHFTSPEPVSAAPAQPNGVGHDEIMIIDSDDEEDPAQGEGLADIEPEFADEEELDQSVPHPPVIQQLDVPLGTAVTRLSFPHIPSDNPKASFANLPRIASQRIIIAVACADNDVRVITVPLIPPAPESTGREGFRRTEQIVMVGAHEHQETPNGVAITFTARDTGLGDDTEVEGDEDEGSLGSHFGTSRRRSLSGARRVGLEQEWDLLVASISPEISGLLLVSKVPILSTSNKSSKEPGISTDPVSPFQRQILPSPASSISFNPSSYQVRRHSHLLVVGAGSAARIYECLSPQSQPAKLSSGRRSSVYRSSTTDKGSWRLSLYPGFENSKATASKGAPHRKIIVAATWILAGKAILALLADGEWGIWDIEGANPASSIEGLGGELGKSALQGGSKTLWSLSGWIEKPTSKSTFTGEPSTKNEKVSGFAPRTPHTRRMGEDVLFSGNPKDFHGYAQGGITARRIPGVHSNATGDEAVVIWYDGTIAAIPSLISFWKFQLQRSRGAGSGSLFSSHQDGQLTKLEGIQLYGEMISEINLFPTPSKVQARPAPAHSFTSRSNTSKMSFPFDVLIAAEHRLVIASTPKPERKRALAAAEKEHSGSDEQLMTAGDLDVNGIDRVLATMDDQGPRDPAKAARRVGFVSPS